MQGESVIVWSPRRKGAKSCMTGHDRRRVRGCSVLVLSGQPTKNQSNSNSERNSKFAGGTVISVECPCTRAHFCIQNVYRLTKEVAHEKHTDVS